VIGITITPHYFRHRFFTECGKANVPLADVKAISGIKDIQVLLNYYSHTTNEGQDKVLDVTRV
jgi:integrase